jgi:RNA polymerase sigma factor (sigma-70 family)
VKSLSDQELLAEYDHHRSEAAFTELVGRHVDLVYSSALRIVRDSHLAEDVTQSVFVALAQNAASLAGHPVIVGWLHRTTQNLAANVVREEVRRREREKKASHMSDNTAGTDVWHTVEPHIEEALSALRDEDRNLVLLRYFEGKSAREIATLIGTGEGTAQRRLNRAVEKIRRFLQNRSISVGASTLAVTLSAHAVKAAPPGLAATVSNAATQSILNNLITASVTKGVVVSTTHKTVVALSIAVAVGTGVYELQQSNQRQQQASMAAKAIQDLNGRFETLRLKHENALAQIESLQRIADRHKSEAAEVHRLRGEVSQLRSGAGKTKGSDEPGKIDPAETALISWLNRTDAFKKAQYRLPDKAIPELVLLTEEDWLEMAKEHERSVSASLPSDNSEVNDSEVNRKLLKIARTKAKIKFGFLLSTALNRFREQHDDQLPTDITLLRPYFQDRESHLGGSAELINDAMLQRYEVLQSGTFEKVPAKDVVILAETAPADPGLDTRLVIGKHWITAADQSEPTYWSGSSNSQSPMHMGNDHQESHHHVQTPFRK